MSKIFHANAKIKSLIIYNTLIKKVELNSPFSLLFFIIFGSNRRILKKFSRSVLKTGDESWLKGLTKFIENLSKNQFLFIFYHGSPLTSIYLNNYPLLLSGKANLHIVWIYFLLCVLFAIKIRISYYIFIWR